MVYLYGLQTAVLARHTGLVLRGEVGAAQPLKYKTTVIRGKPTHSVHVLIPHLKAREFLRIQSKNRADRERYL